MQNRLHLLFTAGQHIAALMLGSTFFPLADPARAASITVIPVANGSAFDPYDKDFAPVGNRLQPSIGPNANDKEERSAIELSLGLVPAGMKIDMATFILTIAGGRGDDAGLEAHGYTGNGRIEQADFQVNNRLAGPAGGMDPFTTPQDISAFVRNIYDNGGTHVGLMFRVTKNAMRAIYANGDQSVAPKLTVEFSDKAAPAPEPGNLSVGLAAIGMGLIWAGRTRLRTCKAKA